MIVRPKVNLFLEITARRADGFHEVVTVMQTVANVTDVLEVAPAKGLTLTIDDQRAPALADGGRVLPPAPMPAPIPADERNLVIKAARALQKRTGADKGARFHLLKRVPDGAGLGGGSADAAAALILLNQLWRLDLPPGELAAAAAEVGSDVAFFLYGGVALCTGRGEKIAPLAGAKEVPVTLIIPPWQTATAAAYRALDPGDFAHHPAEGFLAALRRGAAPGELLAASFNVFESATAKLEPRQAELQALLAAHGCPARLSGSGACLWAPAIDAGKREELQAALAASPRLRGTRLA